MKKIQIVFGMACLMMLAVTQNSFAGVNWNWSFDQNNLIVSPNDTAVLNAVLFNDVSSTANITYASFSGASDSRITANSPYTFSFGPNGDFFSQFGGINLAPGQSYNFVFGTETPMDSPVAEGTSVQDLASLSLGNFGTIAQNYQITVGEGSTSVVPEAPSLILMIVGLMGIVVFTSKSRIKSERCGKTPLSII